MAEDEKKAVESEDGKKAAELANEDLEEIAGGFSIPQCSINIDPTDPNSILLIRGSE